MTNHRNSARLAGLAACLAAGTVAHAQDLSPDTGVWIRAGGVLRAGMKVDFKDRYVPTPAGEGIFANGFVSRSVATNSPYTWNWGYQSASQVSGNTIQYQRVDNAPRVGSLSAGVGTEFGGELRAGFEVTRFTLRKREIAFGLEAGYGYTTVSAHASGTASGLADVTTAAYSFVGADGLPIVLPAAPYSGTFAGPGPLVGRVPVSGPTTTKVFQSSDLRMDLTSHLHVAKVGAYFETDITKKLSAGMSVGYCSILPDTTFTYSDAPAGIGATRLRRSDWRPGGYFELRAQYDFTKHFGAYVGGQFEYNGDSTFGDSQRSATLKLGGVYGGTVGIRWKF